MIQEVMHYAQTHRCSDIHLIANEIPIVRELNDLIRLKFPPITETELLSFIKLILSVEQYERYQAGHDIDFAHTDEQNQRYRINIFHQKGHSAMVLRLLNSVIPSMEDLSLPDVLKKIIQMKQGLVVVTGPTGSGKSTTLAAMINDINQNQSKHILTIEDPLEYLHNSKKSLVNQRELHRDVTDFNSALRSALREDPDVILLGEMRDYETISLALTAAETGHLVFSTLHTMGAATTIDRIIDVFPSEQQNQIRTQLASTLRAVVSQKLVVRSDKNERIAVFEIMLTNDAIGNLIRENKVVQINSAIQTGKNQGMQTLESDLVRHVKAGRISKETAYEFGADKETKNAYWSIKPLLKLKQFN